MVKMYKLKLTRLQQEIMRFLYVKAGTSFNARALARHLKVSQPAISKALPHLANEELVNVKKDKDSGRLSIELNRDNPLVIGYKRAENLRMLYESGLAEFLHETFPGGTIILFGSYSRGEDVWTKELEEYKSDIDIAIIGTKSKGIDLTKYEKELEREIVINFYPSWKDIHKHLKNNILNGIVLDGGIEL